MVAKSGGGSGHEGGRSLKTKVRTAKKRSLSSTLWLERQLNDPFVAQARRAEGLGVTAPLFEKRVVRARFEGEEIGNSTRFRIGGREQIFRGELVFAHVLFDAKGRDLHKKSLARKLRDCRGPN